VLLDCRQTDPGACEHQASSDDATRSRVVLLARVGHACAQGVLLAGEHARTGALRLFVACAFDAGDGVLLVSEPD
jgi:hypothetical protein